MTLRVGIDGRHIGSNAGIGRYSNQVVIRRMISFFYTGRRYRCPCCGGHFRKLKPFGITPRSNALCPRCGSLERHRLLWLYLNDRTNLFAEQLRLLHFAPEGCFERVFKSMTNLNYTSADLISPTAMLRVDITDIPFPDNSFDAIICNHVLEHVPDDRKAISELYRVLEPGGWAIIQSPVDPMREKTYEDATVMTSEARERLFGQRDHVRIYGRDYSERLGAVGFTVVVDDYARKLEPEVSKRGALDTNEDVYFCTKPSDCILCPIPV